MPQPANLFCFFFNDTATTEIYTLSLHDALPISAPPGRTYHASAPGARRALTTSPTTPLAGRQRARSGRRSEEHTSELQSRLHLVCRLLLEKKKTSTGGTSTGPPRCRCSHSQAAD